MLDLLSGQVKRAVTLLREAVEKAKPIQKWIKSHSPSSWTTTPKFCIRAEKIKRVIRQSSAQNRFVTFLGTADSVIHNGWLE